MVTAIMYIYVYMYARVTHQCVIQNGMEKASFAQITGADLSTQARHATPLTVKLAKHLYMFENVKWWLLTMATFRFIGGAFEPHAASMGNECMPRSKLGTWHKSSLTLTFWEKDITGRYIDISI